MERNPNTNGVILSRSELGRCLLSVSEALFGKEQFVGEVERFFEEVREIEGQVTPLPDGRLAFNRRASQLLLQVLDEQINSCEADMHPLEDNDHAKEWASRAEKAMPGAIALYEELSGCLKETQSNGDPNYTWGGYYIGQLGIK